MDGRAGPAAVAASGALRFGLWRLAPRVALPPSDRCRTGPTSTPFIATAIDRKRWPHQEPGLM